MVGRSQATETCIACHNHSASYILPLLPVALPRPPARSLPALPALFTLGLRRCTLSEDGIFGGCGLTNGISSLLSAPSVHVWLVFKDSANINDSDLKECSGRDSNKLCRPHQHKLSQLLIWEPLQVAYHQENHFILIHFSLYQTAARNCPPNTFIHCDIGILGIGTWIRVLPLSTTLTVLSGFWHFASFARLGTVTAGDGAICK